MTDTLSVELTVAATPEHAFATWTHRFATWWPSNKTVTGAPAALAFEPYVGGRIVETGPDGTQHTWGEVLAWEPPRLLRFTWHLFFDPAEATEVEVTFSADGDATLVRLRQSGFARLGASAESRQADTLGAWRRLIARYAAVV